MSTPEHEGQVEQRSSVKIATNAKQEAQVEVKVYDGADEVEVTRIRELAVSTYKAAREAVT